MQSSWKKVVRRYFDCLLAHEFKWSEQDLANTTQEFYNDCVLYIQKKAYFSKPKPEDTKNGKK